jgi:hypothetical protein
MRWIVGERPRWRTQRVKWNPVSFGSISRFAEAIYRAAVVSGIMEQVAYQDTITEAG